MNTQKFFVFLFVLGSLLFTHAALSSTPLYAQAEVDSVTKHFSLPVPQAWTTVNAASSETCDVIATLNLYRNQRVQVIYEWSNCSSAVTVDWEIVSIQNAKGQFTSFNDRGSKYPYNQIWTALKAGDRVALHTHINGVEYGEIATHYTGKPPVWVKIDTRRDVANRQCFQFIGETDPWATFSAGDKSYTRHLSSEQWQTDWLEGPNQPTVNWHAKFYKDEAMTELINEYAFNNIANPCYQPPALCQSVNASPMNGAEIKKDGENVQVTVNALNASQYRILGPKGEVFVAPNSSNTLSFLAKPDTHYQIEVLGSGKDAAWVSSEACQLEYQAPPPVLCQSLDASPINGAEIKQEGENVQVTVNALNASQYRILGPKGEVIVAPSSSNTLSFLAKPDTHYQIEVLGSGKDAAWISSDACQLEYKTPPPPPPAVCQSLDATPMNGAEIKKEGENVKVTVNALNASQYRVLGPNGEVLVAPSSSNTLSFLAKPSMHYQIEILGLGKDAAWTSSDACQLEYQAPPPVLCQSLDASPMNGAEIKQDGENVQVTVNALNASQYRVLGTNGEVIVAPNSSNTFSFLAKPDTHYQIEVLGSGKDTAWISSDACQLEYQAQPPVLCQSLDASPMNGAEIKQEGENVQVTVNALNASQYRITGSNSEVVVAPSSSNSLSFLAKPDTHYQIEVLGKNAAWISSAACQLEYQAPPPVLCQSLDASPINGATIQKEGQQVKVTVNALNASHYRIMSSNGEVVAEPSNSKTLSFWAKPGVRYQLEIIGSGEHSQWIGSENCELRYSIVEEPEPVDLAECLSIDSTLDSGALIPSEGQEVEVTCHAINATVYRIVDENNLEIVPPSDNPVMRFHALPNVTYHVEVANQKQPWSRQANRNCSLRFATAAVQCSLEASHYGDPIGKSRIITWVVDEQQTRQLSQLSINKVVINWDHVATVNYPTANQRGPWLTNQAFELVSEPEVMDVGFGRYTYEAWVYVQGFAEPAYCTATGHAQDHDNLIPDPGPFAKANPEGKFQRSNQPSRLPSVGQLPFDGGNGSDKVELILWAFEKQGHGTDAKITAIANQGKPIARLGMESVSNYIKFDGIAAREGIVYGFQIGEHGPWSPLFCPAPDSNPTTITVFWGAGGQTWLSDYAAYGDCWWLTAAAALNGWVTVDEKVATYNALQPVIDWNGHRNLVFSLAQDKSTGLGPRMQDAVIGLQAREWQGELIPADHPQDFEQRIAEYEAQ